MDSYSLKQHDTTGELHLFKGRMPAADPKFTCDNIAQKSQCKEMDKKDSSTNKFSCETEQVAREKCAKIGREVCGTCVSTLYKTK